MGGFSFFLFLRHLHITFGYLLILLLVRFHKAFQFFAFLSICLFDLLDFFVHENTYSVISDAAIAWLFLCPDISISLMLEPIVFLLVPFLSGIGWHSYSRSWR
jgi:hypothetical protein